MRKRKSKSSIYRSGFEETVTSFLKQSGVPHEYETLKLNYTIPESKHTYTPDVILPNGIICEIKGYFDATCRIKMELVIKQNPHLDIRFCFQNGKNKISKSSKTTYEMWCTKKGFKFGTATDIVAWSKEKAK